MKANIAPGYNKSRVKLADRIPLATPFTLYIASSHICNFKCSYCMQSWSKEEQNKLGFETKLMEYDLFLKLASQLNKFPEKIKLILFTGMGEPLVNPKLPDMVAHLKNLNVAESIEINTNASLLTAKCAHALVDAGLNKIKISIQGLSTEHYQKTSGVNVDFEKLVENITYFYQNKKNTNVYIKIIDHLLENESNKEKFFEIFGEISDEIFIEHLVLAQNPMGDYDGKVNGALTLYMEEVDRKNVCPLVFYVLQIDAFGNVFPCTPLGLPKEFAIGNVQSEVLSEIWVGKKINDLRVMQLKSERYKHGVCGPCDNFNCCTHETENLDRDADTLLKKIYGDNIHES